MKKKNLFKGLILLAVILNLKTSFGQNVMITTVVDGTVASDVCSGSTGNSPRFLELYVSGTIDFTGYDLDVETNGSYDVNGIKWVSKNISSFGSISNQFIYLVLTDDLIAFDAAFPDKTRIGIALGAINGNDSFRIEDDTGNILDIFGNPAEIINSSIDPTWNYKNSYAKRKKGKTANRGNFNENDFTYPGENTLNGADCSTLAAAVKLGSYLAWTGTTDSSWTKTTNWSTGLVPVVSDDILIPSGLTNYPTITTGSSIIVNSIVIESGASLIAQGTSTVTGNITYNRALTYDADNAKSWHLVSSPVSGEIMTDMISNNSFSTNGSSEISFAPYDNSQAIANDRWSYFGNTATDALEKGKGYSAKLSADGDISFTGTINTSDATIALTQGGSENNYNLLGNPFTASINSGTFLISNTSELSQEEIYVWDEASEQYLTKTSGIEFMVSPAQGFFVEAKTTNNITFSEGIQAHETDNFQKTSRPEIKLNVTDGSSNRFVDIYYINGTTTGFDNGYDGKLFGGVAQPFALYTHLVSDSEGKNFQIQSLPNSDYENMIIPLGINAINGTEIKFTAKGLNLPSNINIYLEDKLKSSYTRLDTDNTAYKVTLTEDLKGIGRFFLHTSSKSTLTINSKNIETVSIYKTSETTLRIVGLSQNKTSLKLFNILGKKMMNTSFLSNGVKDISIPKLAKGIYIIQLEN